MGETDHGRRVFEKTVARMMDEGRKLGATKQSEAEVRKHVQGIAREAEQNQEQHRRRR